MSKGGRLSRLFPKLFRGESKTKDGSIANEVKGPFCIVFLLDDAEKKISYKGNWKGQNIFDSLCAMLNLLERDYFGLRLIDTSGQTHWLDLAKSLSSQLKGCSVPYKLYFCVKFYAADPCKLRDEITRYLFFLQVKRDILQGRLPVSYDEVAELCGYALQSELGDFDPRLHTAGYVSEFCFVPNQTEELEAKIANIHRRCVGASPLMAEQKYLEKVKWLELYGVDLHPVQGESNVEYFLGLTPTGVVVYKQKTKVASYFCGRSQRLAAIDMKFRQQPTVQRSQSRRQARRSNSDSRLVAEQWYNDQHGRTVITVMGQAEPVRAPRHRSLPELQGRQSPRSIKSAPWESKLDYGLYTSGHDSPSVYSDSKYPGSDSQNGFNQRKRYFPNTKTSDNESDASVSRRRRRELDSDSGSEISFPNSSQNRKLRHTMSDKDVKLRNNGNLSIPSLHSAPAGEVKQRRRRRLDVFRFDLVDTEGMTVDQLRDIPYTKIETKASLFRVKYSPKIRHKIWASRRKSFGEADRNSEAKTGSNSTVSRQDSYYTDPTGNYIHGSKISGSVSQGQLPRDSGSQRSYPLNSGYSPSSSARIQHYIPDGHDSDRNNAIQQDRCRQSPLSVHNCLVSNTMNDTERHRNYSTSNQLNAGHHHDNRYQENKYIQIFNQNESNGYSSAQNHSDRGPDINSRNNSYTENYSSTLSPVINSKNSSYIGNNSKSSTQSHSEHKPSHAVRENSFIGGSKDSRSHKPAPHYRDNYSEGVASNGSTPSRGSTKTDYDHRVGSRPRSSYNNQGRPSSSYLGQHVQANDFETVPSKYSTINSHRADSGYTSYNTQLQGQSQHHSPRTGNTESYGTIQVMKLADTLHSDTVIKLVDTLHFDTVIKPVDTLHFDTVIKPVDTLHSDTVMKPVDTLHSDTVMKPVDTLHSDTVMKPVDTLHFDTVIKPVDTLHFDTVIKPVDTLHSDSYKTSIFTSLSHSYKTIVQYIFFY
ncbi:hypothetical protein Btru_070024 [Bulinus truncatus]|nr:hypothetical protein Btru_070024 [Bulinus truncatus]